MGKAGMRKVNEVGVVGQPPPPQPLPDLGRGEGGVKTGDPL